MAGDIMRVTNEEGRTFNVKLIPPRAPASGASRWSNPSMPTVEFYDATYEGKTKFDPLGQFVARYYLADILETRKDAGLLLYAGVPSWRLHAHAMAALQSWLRARILEAGEGA